MTNMKHALHCLILLAVLAAAAAEEEPRWTVGTAEQLEQAATNPTGSNAAVPVTRLSKPPLIGGAAQEWRAAVPLVTFPLATLGVRAASTPYAGKGYKVEASLPWALLAGKPGGKARLAWQVRWGDRTGTLAALVAQDGLTRHLSGGADALAMPADWAPVEWLT